MEGTSLHIVDVHDHLVRVRFSLVPDSDWPPSTAEVLWAEPGGPDRAYLRNVPFYVKGVAYDDLIAIEEKDNGDVPEFLRVAEHRGHSTYRIMLIDTADESAFSRWWKKLEDLGCTYERANEMLVAIDMSPDTSVHDAYKILEQGLAAGVWDFEEGFYYNPGGSA